MVGSNKEEENYYFLSQYELVADDEDDDGRSDDDGGGDGSGRGGPGGGVRGGGVSVAVRSAVDDKKNRNTTFAIHVSDVGDFAGAKLILYERETSFKLSLRNAATNETYSFHYEICRGNVINFYKSTCKSKVDINVPLDCLTKGSCNTMNALLHAQAVGMLEIKGISVENMDLVTNFENIRLKLENQSRIVFCTSLQKFDQIMMFNTKITNYCEVEHINLTLFLPDKTIYRYRVRGRGRIPCNICQWTGVKEKVITAQSTQKVTRATHITQKGTTSSTRVSQHADTAIITRVSQPEDTITTTLVSQPEDTITTTLVSQPEDTTTTTLVSQPEDTVTSTLVPQPENTTISTQMGTEKTAAIKTDKPLTTEKDRVPTFNATETNVPVTVPTTEEILCLCPCNIKTKTKLENLTSEELHEKLAAELSIPRKETSKYVRSKLSMPDSRVSSNVIGSIITVAIVMPFASIILIDFVALVKWVFFTLKASR
ncbi:A-agglutinin anchorage subunit-like [Argonauta hians]